LWETNLFFSILNNPQGSFLKIRILRKYLWLFDIIALIMSIFIALSVSNVLVVSRQY